MPAISWYDFPSTYRRSTSDSSGESTPVKPALMLAASHAEMTISAWEAASIKAGFTGVLSPLESEVLRLYVDGKSYQEIAGMLGRHVKSIDNALQRVKRKVEIQIRRSRAC